MSVSLSSKRYIQAAYVLLKLHGCIGFKEPVWSIVKNYQNHISILNSICYEGHILTLCTRRDAYKTYPSNWHVRPAKKHISPEIHTVYSESGVNYMCRVYSSGQGRLKSELAYTQSDQIVLLGAQRMLETLTTICAMTKWAGIKHSSWHVRTAKIQNQSVHPHSLIKPEQTLNPWLSM